VSLIVVQLLVLSRERKIVRVEPTVELWSRRFLKPFSPPSSVLTDNISTPIAACLSDLVTLFILGIVGTLLLPYINTPVPFFFLPFLILAGGGFAWTTLRNEHVKGLVRDGWTPLLAAVSISSATGMVLEQCVGRYEGYAILAVAMTGESFFVPYSFFSPFQVSSDAYRPIKLFIFLLIAFSFAHPGLSGAVGSIHASRLSTILHQAHPPSPPPESAALTTGYSSPGPHSSHFIHHPSEEPPEDVAAPRAIAVALFVIAIPVQIFFLLFVGLAGWMRVGEWQLVVSFVLVFGMTVRFLLRLFSLSLSLLSLRESRAKTRADVFFSSPLSMTRLSLGLHLHLDSRSVNALFLVPESGS